MIEYGPPRLRPGLYNVEAEYLEAQHMTFEVGAETCAVCNLPIEPRGSVFCCRCGAFQPAGSGPDPLPAASIAKQNPSMAFAATFEAKPGYTATAQDMLLLKHQLAEAIDDTLLAHAARDEFDRLAAVHLRTGAMSPATYALWVAYWKKLSTAAEETISFLAQKRAEFADSPAMLVLLEQHQALFDAFIGRLTTQPADISVFANLQLRLSLAVEAMEVALLRLRGILNLEKLHAFRWVIEFNESGYETLPADDETGANTARMLWEATSAATGPDAGAILSNDPFANTQLHARWKLLQESLVRAAGASPDFHLNFTRWRNAAFKGWVSVLGLQVQELMDSRLGLREISNIVRQQEETIAANAKLAPASLQQKIQAHAGISSTVSSRIAQMNNEAEVREREQDAFIEKLLAAEQSNRFMAQGRPGLALVTDLFGSRAGSIMEGLSR